MHDRRIDSLVAAKAKKALWQALMAAMTRNGKQQILLIFKQLKCPTLSRRHCTKLPHTPTHRGKENINLRMTCKSEHSKTNGEYASTLPYNAALPHQATSVITLWFLSLWAATWLPRAQHLQTLVSTAVTMSSPIAVAIVNASLGDAH